MEYKILQWTTIGHLEKDVNQHIEEGWKPQGGVAVAASPYGGAFLQAIVRDKK